MFTEFKNLRKAFNTVFGKKGGVIDNIEDNYAPCDCGNEDDIVSADSISIKEAFLEYCGINLIEVVTLMSSHSLTNFVNFRVKYFSEGIDYEFEIKIRRADTIHTVACVGCNECLGAYIVHHFMYPEYLTKDKYIGSAEEHFDKIFREKEKVFFEKNKQAMIKKEKVKKAREICGYK